MNEKYAVLGTAIATLLISSLVSIVNPSGAAPIVDLSQTLIGGCLGAFVGNNKKEDK